MKRDTIIRVLVTFFAILLPACRVSGSVAGEKESAGSLPGMWHASETVGAFYADRYLIEENGTFTYAASQARTNDKLRYTTGRWWTEGRLLCFSATSLLVLENGVYVRRDLDQASRVVEKYPLAFLEPDERGVVSIMVGEDRLWLAPAVYAEDLTRFRDNVDFWSDWNGTLDIPDAGKDENEETAGARTAKHKEPATQPDAKPRRGSA